MEEKRCYKCNGKLDIWDTNELQKRFSDNIQQYLCNFCTELANDAIRKSRSYYGIDGKAWNIVLRRFKRKHKIPMLGRCNAMQNEMILNKRKALLRLMFWMDIRAVKKVLEN